MRSSMLSPRFCECTGRPTAAFHRRVADRRLWTSRQIGRYPETRFWECGAGVLKPNPATPSRQRPAEILANFSPWHLLGKAGSLALLRTDCRQESAKTKP